MQPGASVTYRVDKPIAAFRVFSFARNVDAGLELSGSSDGSEFRPLNAARNVFSSNEGDYGYLTPVLYAASTDGNAITHLKIRMPTAHVGDDGANARSAASEAAPIEISRVEIVYDRVH
jgi:hypothetical protein